MTEDLAQREIAHEQAVVDRVHVRSRDRSALPRRWPAKGTPGHGSGTRAAWSNAMRSCSRPASGWPPSTPPTTGLVFGRLDMRDRDVRYIGRLGLRDAEHEVLLIDWRAPAAAVFYQATAENPADVVRRRVLQSSGDTVVGIEDDLLDPDNVPADLVVVGEGALIAALSRSRDRSMHSVVATIQKEQDDAIRSPHRGVTTISGGPGTGKTVVALHRAAYLLYTDRRRYLGGGVLVVGPNPVFMSYIERVLPSLGETSVSMRALGAVVDGVRAVRHDRSESPTSRARFRCAVCWSGRPADQVPGAPTTLRIFFRDDVLTFDERELAAARRSLLSGGQRRNRAAPRVAEELIDRLWRQVSGDRARPGPGLAHTMYGSRDFTEFVRTWWPVLDAVDVLRWLADRDRLARTHEICSRHEK